MGRFPGDQRRGIQERVASGEAKSARYLISQAVIIYDLGKGCVVAERPGAGEQSGGGSVVKGLWR